MDATLRQLRAYIAVARAASFTVAADELHVSQSSLSRAVAEFERRLGVQLLERDTRNVQLTPAGAETLRVAQQIVQTHQAGMRELARYLAGESGIVALATLPSIAARLLPPAISAFRDRWPSVSIRILDGLERSVLDHVQAGDADFAVTTAFAPHRRLHHEPLLKDRFLALLPPQHPLTARAQVTWTDLAGEPFVTLGPDSSVRRLTDAAFHDAGLAVAPAAEASSLATVGGLVAAGLGVTAMPALVLPLMGTELVDRPLIDPVLDRPLDIVTRAHRPLPVAAEHFLTVLRTMREDRLLLPDGVTWI